MIPTLTPTLPNQANDTEKSLIAKIDLNLYALFKLMSNNQWKGTVLYGGPACMCSTQQILAVIAQNIWSFFYWVAANGLPTSTNYDQAGQLALTTGTSTQAVVFSTAFPGPKAPAVVCNLIPPGGGNPVLVVPATVTLAGFTADWGFAVPAGYTLSWGALAATQ